MTSELQTSGKKYKCCDSEYNDDRLQGGKLIFKPISINCFVLPRNPASMLQIRDVTYKNVTYIRIQASYLYRTLAFEQLCSAVQCRSTAVEKCNK